MKEFWDNRYAAPEYAYGVKPNEFLKNTLVDLNLKGKILLPAEGEGRNAVFAAKLGLEVVAFDFSQEGKKKACELADQNNVKINYIIREFSEIEFEQNSFDIIALTFAHFHLSVRENYHKKLCKFLKMGGILILEAFSKNHLELSKINPSVGGPKNIEMLFSKEETRNDFSELEVVKLAEEEVFLEEGNCHRGKSSVIRFIGRKNNELQNES